MAAMGAVNAEVANTPNEFQFLESLKVNKTLQAIDGYRVKQYKQSPKYIFSMRDENSLKENLHSNIESGADNLRHDNRDSPPTSVTVSKKQGSGGFGCVFRGTMKGKDICLKLSKSSRRDNEKYLIREARNFRLLKDTNHENIIRFHFVCYIMDCERACIVMDYFPGGDLNRFVREYRREGKRPHKTRINKIIRGIVSAVTYMQTFSMIHCDIKPDNVLYNCSSMEVKVIDFGCAVVYGGTDKLRSKDFGGTPIYMAPEMLEDQKRPYLDSTDVYSVGALIFKLLTLRNPWDDDVNIYEARKEEGGHRHRLIKQALLSAMANRAEASDEGVHKEYTKLQVALLNNLADHRRIYLKQCNLACDMLNYHPIDRPRCDDILTELDTIMDEGLYDSAHRNDHREHIVAQLSHVFEATNLDSAEAVPSLLAQFDNSTCSGSTYKGTEVPSAMLSEDRRLLAEHRDPRGGTGITTHTCSTDPSLNSTGCRQSDSDSDHGGVGSALQTADGYVQFTNHGDDRVQVWPIRSEASDNDQLEWSDIESFKDATVGLEDTTGFSANQVESHDIENTSVSVDTVMEAWTLDSTMVDSQACARKRRYISGMTMSSFDESAIPDDLVLGLLQTESEQR